jgi:hypothetical protein
MALQVRIGERLISAVVNRRKNKRLSHPLRLELARFAIIAVGGTGDVDEGARRVRMALQVRIGEKEVLQAVLGMLQPATSNSSARDVAYCSCRFCSALIKIAVELAPKAGLGALSAA